MEVSGVVDCGWWEEEKGWDIWVVSDWGAWRWDGWDVMWCDVMCGWNGWM